MTFYGHDVVEIFINWFPMLLLIGVWVFFCLRMGVGGRYMSPYQRDHMAVVQRQTEILERIAAALERQTR